MNLLPRTSMLVVLIVAAPLLTFGVTVQASESPDALTIDGDPITRLASSSPDAAAQVVAGTGLYIRDAAAEWSQSGDAPGPGEIVFAADEPALLLSGNHAPCLRGGVAPPLERSENGGADWQRVEGAEAMRPLAIWRESGIALGATCSGLKISTDAGQNWSDISGIDPGYEVTAFASVDSGDDDHGSSVLFGMTGEGGTSRLYRLDLRDPDAPTVSEPLREYWAVAGIAGRGELYVLAAADGVWVSEDAGATWERSADGLEDVTLEADPAQAGLAAGVEPGSFGLFAAAFVHEDDEAMVVGSVNGLYASGSPAGPWSPVPGSVDEVRRIDTVLDGDRLLFATGDMVFDAATPIPVAAGESLAYRGGRCGGAGGYCVLREDQVA